MIRLADLVRDHVTVEVSWRSLLKLIAAVALVWPAHRDVGVRDDVRLRRADDPESARRLAARGVLAGICDFIPLLGFILSAVPGILLAATVSARTGLMVLVWYVAYHTIETYLIAPRVDGDRLKLSDLAVVLAMAVGAELAGVVGAAIALPLAAIHSAVEQIWLGDKLPDDTISAHRAIDRQAS